jgi:phage gp36-like protein
LVNIPAAVLMACIHIALYWLFTRREEVLGAVPEARTKAYEAQISWLKMVARGEATLGEIPEEQVPNAATTPEYEVNKREFTSETMRQW